MTGLYREKGKENDPFRLSEHDIKRTFPVTDWKPEILERPGNVCVE